MKISKQVEEFWRKYCEENPQVNGNTPFQVWHFGLEQKDAEELLNLVFEGKKRATSSLVWEYEDKPEEAPILNGYSVVTDVEGSPKCVVRTTEVRVLPFNEVDAEFAFDEGEDDLSLECWRGVHWDYFSTRCAQIGREPNLEMPIICERFELLYPKNE